MTRLMFVVSHIFDWFARPRFHRFAPDYDDIGTSVMARLGDNESSRDGGSA